MLMYPKYRNTFLSKEETQIYKKNKELLAKKIRDDVTKSQILTGQQQLVLSYSGGPAGSRPPEKGIFFLQSIKKHFIYHTSYDKQGGRHAI